jgi:hypothetical protein
MARNETVSDRKLLFEVQLWVEGSPHYLLVLLEYRQNQPRRLPLAIGQLNLRVESWSLWVAEAHFLE